MVSEKERNFINEKIKYLQQNLNAPPFREYTFSYDTIERLRRYISTNGKNDSVIKDTVGEILSHIGMIKQWVDVNVVYNPVDENANTGYAGIYNETGILYGKIDIIINPHYDADMIIAIACHECAHNFLLKRKIKLEDKPENEKLTDIAAVYMGFGSYMIKGYSNIKSKLGYLHNDEMYYAHGEIKKLQSSEEIRQDIINDLKTDIKQRIVNLRTNISVNKSAIQPVSFNIPYNTEGYLKLIYENFNLIQNGEIDKWIVYFSEKVKNPQLTVSDLRIIQNEIEGYIARLSEYNKAIDKFMLLAEHQLNLSREAISLIKKMHNDALNGDSNSMFMLIKYYLSIPEFLDDARFYFEKLSKSQEVESYCYIGDCYCNGILVKKNLDTARHYYYNAMQMGFPAAKEKFDKTYFDVDILYAE